MRGLLVFLNLCTAAQVHCLWNYQSFDFSPPEGWARAWKEVEQLVPEAPPSKLIVEWPNREKIEPNTSTSVGRMTERPFLKWETRPWTLYTVMFVDAGIKRVLPKGFLHWMVTNIQGNSVKWGNEVMEYITPFSLEFDENSQFITDREQSSHPLIMLVFKQPKYLIVDETHAGCNPEILTERIFDYRDLADKYGLELVAGNFLQMPYSGYSTKSMVCRITKCTKTDFPFLIPGVNDQPECKPRKDIMEIVVRGPQLDKLKEYSRLTSAYSLDSVTHIIQDTFPAGSTGKAIEYTAIEGAFSAPFGTDNLDNTLQGIVDATFYNYQNISATEGFFVGEFPEVLQVLPSTLQTMAGNAAVTITLSEPLDQDFEFENIINRKGKVFDLCIVSVREGKEAEFQETRDTLITRGRNSKNVESVTKFDLNRDVLANPEGGLQIDTENMEQTIIVYESRAARRKAYAEIEGTAEMKNYLETFDCIMCALMTEQSRPEYFPPFE